MPKSADLDVLYHYTPSLVGRQVEARYEQQLISGYRDNPYIEALPPIFEEKYVAMNVGKFPEYSDEQRNLGNQIRLHLVQQISDYIEPLPQHLLIEQRLSRLIRHGYKARNPFYPETVKQYHIGFKEILEAGTEKDGANIAGVRSTANGFAILGVSGQGKTTAIESSLLLYPQVIHHASYNGQPFIRKQLVWLKLNCPFDGSLKGLCLNFFQAVDAHLGTNYFGKFASKGSSADILIPMMAHIATLHGLGTLVIDEIQNLSFMKSGGAERMLNYFTQLINTIGVPVVIIGTFKAMKLLSGSFSQARRSTGQGDLIVDRLTEGEEWEFFVERLWRYQWTRTPTKLSGPIKKAMYDLSQGIIDIAVKLYMLTQWELIMDGDEREQITSKVLRAVANKHMRLVQPLLRALKANEPGHTQLVDDLKPSWGTLDEFLQTAMEKVHLQGEIRRLLKRDEKTEVDQERYLELVKTALDFGATAEVAEKITDRILQRNELDRNIVELRKELVQELGTIFKPSVEQSSQPPANTKPKSLQRASKKEQKPQDIDDLRRAAKSTKAKGEEIYNNLVELGSIDSPEDIIKLTV